jgi:hypothetical protein
VPYGLTDAEWDNAKGQIRTILTDTAAAGDLIEYGKLTARLQGVEVHPHHGGTLSHLLAEIQDEDHAAGEPLLPALVVSQATQQPSDGFWKKARRLGCSFGDPTEFWVGQCNRLYERHGG